MKEVDLQLLSITGAKAISPLQIKVSVVSKDGGSIDLQFSMNAAMQLNEYLRMAQKTVGLVVPQDQSNYPHQTPDQVYEINETKGIWIGVKVHFSVTTLPDTQLLFESSIRDAMRLIHFINQIANEQGWVPKKDRCLFVENSKRCNSRRKGMSTFCENHQNKFRNLDNQHLLDLLTDMFKRSLAVDDSKKIAPSGDSIAYIEFTNCWNELRNRGYRPDEINESIGQLAKNKGVFDELSRKVGAEPKWKKFEKLILGIHLLNKEGAEIKLDDTIAGKRTSRPRQIDISLKFHQGYYDYLAIVECKDTLVSIDMVESFKTKIEDVGAHRGIVVTSKGYQSGAVEAAKAYDIELFKLSEESTDWIVKVREDVHEFPFASQIAFDHPPMNPEQQIEPSSDVDWRNIPFIDRNGHRTNLGDIITDTCMWAHENKVDLPLIVNIRFESGMSFRLPSATTMIPISGIRITLIKWRLRIKRSVDLPPKVEKYIYSDFKGANEVRVAASEVVKAIANYEKRKEKTDESQP